MPDVGFNPEKITPYRGRSFETTNGKKYGIDQKGKFSGTGKTAAINGADVARIAGIEGEHYRNMREALDPGFSSFEASVEAFEEYGKEPKAGLHLAFGLTPEASQSTEYFGMITSKLK